MRLDIDLSVAQEEVSGIHLQGQMDSLIAVPSANPAHDQRCNVPRAQNSAKPLQGNLYLRQSTEVPNLDRMQFVILTATGPWSHAHALHQNRHACNRKITGQYEIVVAGSLVEGSPCLALCSDSY